MTIDEAVNYIRCVSSLGTKPGLERISALLDSLGNPENGIMAVHVAGTNGKGSFCAMLASVLRCAGYSVGVYTSPHLEKYNERFSFNGMDITDSELASCVDSVVAAAGNIPTGIGRPSEFEILTAAAYLWFAQKKPDFCIIECGMGGRWDATNVIKSPVLSVITGVALDHTAYLGGTTSEIASEKAGIIKCGRPVLFGGNDPDALTVISSAAAEKNAPLYLTGREKINDCVYRSDGSSFSYRGEKYEICLPGHYQPFNAANVIEAVNILREEGFAVSDGALREGLFCTRWKGRFQKMRVEPPVYFDGGHNPEGVSEAVASVREMFGGRVNVITGMLADKDYAAMAGKIAEVAETVFAVEPDSPRALDVRSLAAEFEKSGVKAEACGSMRAAVKKALDASRENGLPVLCLGSLYSYAAFADALKHEA